MISPRSPVQGRYRAGTGPRIEVTNRAGVISRRTGWWATVRGIWISLTGSPCDPLSPTAYQEVLATPPPLSPGVNVDASVPTTPSVPQSARESLRPSQFQSQRGCISPYDPLSPTVCQNVSTTLQSFRKSLRPSQSHSLPWSHCDPLSPTVYQEVLTSLSVPESTWMHHSLRPSQSHSLSGSPGDPFSPTVTTNNLFLKNCYSSLTFTPLSTPIVILNPFYYLLKSLLLKATRVFKHRDWQMFVLKLYIYQ